MHDAWKRSSMARQCDTRGAQSMLRFPHNSIPLSANRGDQNIRCKNKTFPRSNSAPRLVDSLVVKRCSFDFRCYRHYHNWSACWALKRIRQTETEGFWRRCITLRSTRFLDCVQWLRLAPSKTTNRVGLPPLSPEDGNKSSFRNVVFLYLEFRTMGTVQKPSDSEYVNVL
jgi:hypothetical protein